MRDINFIVHIITRSQSSDSNFTQFYCKNSPYVDRNVRRIRKQTRNVLLQKFFANTTQGIIRRSTHIRSQQ